MTYKLRKELNALSKELYGCSSKWHSAVYKGIIRPIPVGIINQNGEQATEKSRVYPSLAEIQKRMLEEKAVLDIKNKLENK